MDSFPSEDDEEEEDDDDREVLLADSEDDDDHDHDDEEEDDDDDDDADEEAQSEEMEMEDDEEEEEDDDVPVTTGTGGDSSSSSHHVSVKASPTLQQMFGLREMGRDALCWQLSSAKPGNGVEQVRDNNLETYWQSDGNSQPHWIQVHFGRRMTISHVCLYLDFNLDESYTPRRIRIQFGTTNQDLVSGLNPPNSQIEFHEPCGWCICPLTSPPDPLDDDDDDIDMEDEDDEDADNNDDDEDNPSTTRNKRIGKVSQHRMGVRAHLIRISILSMHQNGRDTHVRQVHLYGPRNYNNGSGQHGQQQRPFASIANMNHNNRTRRLPPHPNPNQDEREQRGTITTAAPDNNDSDHDDLGTIGGQFSTIR